MWSVDGMQFDLPCSIERKASLTASEVSGMLLDKTYMNDVIGTFMEYTIKLAIPIGQEGDYVTLYEILTDPIDAHTWILPYNQGTIELTARVEVISDAYYKEENGVNIWRGIAFTVIANHPSKEYTLDEMVQRGLSPEPPIVMAELGDTYLYTENGWEMVASNLSLGDTMQWDGDTWEFMEVVNLDEVQF